MRNYEQINTHWPGTAQKMSLIRCALPTGLNDIWKQVERNKPDAYIEIRQLGAHFRPFGLQVLGSREMRYQNALSTVALDHLYDRLFYHVPSLDEHLTVTVENVSVFPKTSAYRDRFITLIPTRNDVRKINQEMRNVRQSIEEIARDPSMEWHTKDTDLTLAFIPKYVGQTAVQPMIEAVAPLLPFDITLSPAYCPAMRNR